MPVACDDWYQRRRQDSEGDFLRQIAAQGPKNGLGGGSRQGVYCLTADGTLLGYVNDFDTKRMAKFLEEGLEAWRRLPGDRRRAGAVRIRDDGKSDADYVRPLPEGALVLASCTRPLTADEDKSNPPATHDRIWIRADESKKLLPAEPRVGQKHNVPASLLQRLMRFHLVDNTRGEPDPWRTVDVRRAEAQVETESVNDDEIALVLTGEFLLANQPDPERADRGFEGKLLGKLVWNRKKESWTRFEIIALGDHWGNGSCMPPAPKGRTPLGIAFERIDPSTPRDRLPPQGARDWKAYWGEGR